MSIKRHQLRNNLLVEKVKGISKYFIKDLQALENILDEECNWNGNLIKQLSTSDQEFINSDEIDTDYLFWSLSEDWNEHKKGTKILCCMTENAPAWIFDTPNLSRVYTDSGKSVLLDKYDERIEKLKSALTGLERITEDNTNQSGSTAMSARNKLITIKHRIEWLIKQLDNLI
jgi:hypothetical protein